MGIEAYYLSKKQVSGVGSIFLLNELQDADSSGGGKALLGSVVTQNKSIFHTDYPVPELVSKAGVMQAKLKELLNMGEGDYLLEQDIAAGNRTLKIEKDNSFQLGLGPFPSVPFNAKFQIDYKKTVDINITYGDGTKYIYIRKGALGQLYAHLHGEPDTDMTGKFLKKNAFISRIQLAKNWSVKFSSSKTFDVGVDAQIDLFNKDNSVGGKVKFHKSSSTTIEAEVKGDKYYLVGLMSTLWDEIKMD